MSYGDGVERLVCGNGHPCLRASAERYVGTPCEYEGCGSPLQRGTPVDDIDRGTQPGIRFQTLEAVERERDRAEAALRRIADSYPWIPYEDDETIGDASDLDIGVSIEGYVAPTNRRIARETLRGITSAGNRPTPESDSARSGSQQGNK